MRPTGSNLNIYSIMVCVLIFAFGISGITYFSLKLKSIDNHVLAGVIVGGVLGVIVGPLYAMYIKRIPWHLWSEDAIEDLPFPPPYPFRSKGELKMWRFGMSNGIVFMLMGTAFMNVFIQMMPYSSYLWGLGFGLILGSLCAELLTKKYASSI